VRLRLDGDWTIEGSRTIENGADQLVAAVVEAKRAVLDFSRVGRMDTAGAWLVDRARQTLTARGVQMDIERLRPEYEILLREARFRDFATTRPARGNAFIDFLAAVGAAIEGVGRDIYSSVAFLGDVVVLRELAVLLTSIMIAGRSGSAITAELGSMKMREEIDALKVMGLSPIEVLILPRLSALIISLPLLTFLADMAALFGGLCVAWGYGGISPEAFIARLQTSIGLSTFMIGIVKAPFMALLIGLIASVEGFAVQGSAESLGRQVTSSVVKSIFMVIVADGFFAMFFAGLHY
jgi:ABC transport permease subunit